jgi:transcriptional regulator with XRE-family HTH domain
MSLPDYDFSKLFADAKTRETYWKEKAVLDFTQEVVNRMSDLGVSRSELATRIDVKPAFVTKILRGDNNFTLDTMTKVGRALKARLRVHLEPDGMDSDWLDFLKEEPNWKPASVQTMKLDRGDFQKVEMPELATK